MLQASSRECASLLGRSVETRGVGLLTGELSFSTKANHFHESKACHRLIMHLVQVITSFTCVTIWSRIRVPQFLCSSTMRVELRIRPKIFYFLDNSIDNKYF
jgi:hypothetical protein